jgi:signal transduction histidine kinase
MRTLRGRLAVGYAIALAATMFVFAATIYAVQRADRYEQLDLRVEGQADLIAAILTDAWDRGFGTVVVPGEPLVVAPGQPFFVEDPPSPPVVLAPRVDGLLQSVQDYVVILDTAGTILYASEAVRQSGAIGVERLQAAARAPGPEGQFEVVDLAGTDGEVRYFARTVNSAGPVVAGVLAAASTAGVGVATSRLLVAMLVSGPFLLLASMVVGYVLAGRNIQPVDTIVDEIEAITDGRSLHRRVIEIKRTEELARLTTTLNAMLVRLERNFLSLRRFTADASHELKTPLTVLRAGVERAITHPSASPELMEVLEETLIEVNLMTEIVDSLLTLARVDEGRAPLHLETTDLRDVLAEISETANILGEQAAVNVTVEDPAHPLVLPVDRARVRQLLLNLLTNAIKYTPKGGQVSITCADSPESAVVAVADTGIGIATGDLPHVFDRFWRAEAARSRVQRQGAGLGLAICRWIAEAHGGSIEVQSRRGEGTTFTVTLPREASDAQEVAKI